MRTLEFAARSPVAESVGWSDEEFLAALRFRRTAPVELARAARRRDVVAFAEALADHLASRPGGGKQALKRVLWSRRAFAGNPRADRLLTAAASSGAARSNVRSASRQPRGSRGTLLAAPAVSLAAIAIEWLDGPGESQDVSPVELLLWMEWLSSPEQRLAPEVLFRLWRVLFENVSRLTREAEPAPGTSLEPDQQLLLFGELPWRAGAFFNEIKGSERLRKRGAGFLEHELCERTDQIGTPHATIVPRLPFWLASLLRCHFAAAEQGVPLWDVDACELLGNVAERIAPFCRHDGGLAFSNGCLDDPRSLIEQALSVSGWSDAPLALRSLLADLEPLPRIFRPARPGKKGKPQRRRDAICFSPALQSDSSGLACLRSDWTSAADLIAVAHGGPTPLVELTALGRRLLGGAWRSEARLDGALLPSEGTWNCVCWQSDEDGDYLELQLFVQGILRIDRQVLLSRTGHFAVLADTVAEVGPGRVDYTLRLPLAEGTEVETVQTTRELQVSRAGVTARIFPLALPQDRVVSTPGEFAVRDGELILSQAAQGRGLYAPLVIDWNPERRDEPAQWRSLTVTEDRRVITPDVACGHRVRVGSHQLLVFRSLIRSPEARSVLGHQTRYETVIGTVDSDGDVLPVLMVE